MNLATTLKMRRLCPTFDVRSYPDGEREAISEVARFLTLIGDATYKFEECLGLYTYLLEQREADPEPKRPSRIGTRITHPGEPRSEYDEAIVNWHSDYMIWRHGTPPFEQWQMLVLRSGALELYDHSRVVNLLGVACSKAPTFMERVDRDLRRQAGKLFRSAFPKIEGVRNLAAHPHELAASTVKFSEHAVSGRMMLQDTIVHLDDNKLRPFYQGSYDGKIVGYELSADAVELLWSVSGLIWKAFYGAESELSALSRSTAD